MSVKKYFFHNQKCFEQSNLFLLLFTSYNSFSFYESWFKKMDIFFIKTVTKFSKTSSDPMTNTKITLAFLSIVQSQTFLLHLFP